MSVEAPWQFLGSWFPNMEAPYLLPLGSTGAGTDYPVLWDNVPLEVGDTQIARFQWAAKTVTLSASGTVSYTFDDHINPPEFITKNWSITCSNTPTAGATWDVLETTLEAANAGVGRGFAEIGFDSIDVLYDGYASGDWKFNVSAGFFITGLYAITGSLYTQYAMITIVGIAADVQFFASFEGNNSAGTHSSYGTATGDNATLFHGTTPFYSDADPSKVQITVSNCLLSVTDTFQPPPQLY